MFQLIAEAKSNKEVAVLLDISPATVETHRARILQKLDVHNIAEVVLLRGAPRHHLLIHAIAGAAV